MAAGVQESQNAKQELIEKSITLQDVMTIKEGSETHYLRELRVNGKSWEEMISDHRWKVSPYLAVCKPRKLPPTFTHH